MKNRVWCFALIVGSASCLTLVPDILSAQAAQTRFQPRLELSETFTFSLPENILPSAVSAREGGGYVVWSTSLPWIGLVDEQAGFNKLGWLSVKRPLAVKANRNDLIVLDVIGEKTLNVLRANLSSHAMQGLEVQLPVRPADAAVRASGWFVGGYTDADNYRVFGLTDNGRLTPLFGFSHWLANTSLLGGVHLSATPRDDVLVTFVQAHFGTFRFTADGLLRLHIEVPISDVLDSGHRDRGPALGWVSLPTIPLPEGYLQTLADIASDARIFLLYDFEGRLISRQELDAPLGFFTVHGNRLLGARTTNTVELVGYEYKWLSSSGIPEQP